VEVNMDNENIEKGLAEQGSDSGDAKSSISRRDALKRMAKLAVGIGAVSVLPSALSSCSLFYDDYYDYYDYYSNYYSNYYYYYSNYYSNYYYYYSNYYY
jgi:hypothetical protein